MSVAFAGEKSRRCLHYVNVRWPAWTGLDPVVRCDLVHGHAGGCRVRVGPPDRLVLVAFTLADVGADWTAKVLELAEVSDG